MVFKYELDGVACFCKVLRSQQAAEEEISGYDLISSYYNVPQRRSARLDRKQRFIISYDYWPTIGKDQGLFLDLINQSCSIYSHQLRDFTHSLVKHYYEVISKTIEWKPKEEVRTALYEERLKEGARIDRYYRSVNGLSLSNGTETIPLSRVCNYQFIINRKRYRFDWEDCIRSLKSFFTNSGCWAAITQGDPTEINIGYPLVWFDYGNAGYNAVLGEFANFCWDTYVFGGCFVPRYSPRVLADHPDTFNRVALNAPVLTGFEIDHSAKAIVIDYSLDLPIARRAILCEYFTRLVEPIANKWVGENWQIQFNRYLAVRILGVYNIFSLSLSDTVFSLAKLIECQDSDSDIANIFDF